MARYKIIDAIIKIVEKGKQNEGKKYAILTLQNADNFWDRKLVRRVIFEDYIIETLEPLLSVNKGGTGQINQLPIPETIIPYLVGCTYHWTSPVPFYKRHLNSHEARPARPAMNGKPAQVERPKINAGDLVKDINGNPIIFTGLDVFVEYEKDEFGEKIWINGHPDDIARQAFSAYCEYIKPQIAEENFDEQQIQNQIQAPQYTQPNTNQPQPQYQPQPQPQPQVQGPGQFGGQMPTF